MTLGIFDPAFLAVAGTVVSGGYDADAQAYITAVEAADGQALETGVKDAINAFVVGCKADGIWNAIKASCILAGARTLNGALVPLVGTAPTNFNFASGDYNRKTGLVGNGSTKYLNSNRNNNADPQNNRHLAAYATNSQPSGTGFYIGGRASASSNIGASTLGSDSNQHFSRSSCATLVYVGPTSNGLLGNSRSSSNTYIVRNGQANTAIPQNSEVPADRLLTLFALNQENGIATGVYSNARLAFYSIGESLDLALLDARVTALMYEIQKTLLEGDFDIDAAAYISRVETADGQDLEPAVRTAINNFVIGCKADGIWNAIKASCILAGARTLNGALVPLVGAAPTNFNFVSGDYDRKTGLVGNGSTKYLNSNRNNNADPQNNRHLATYANLTSSAIQLLAGGRSTASGTGATLLGWSGTQPQFRCIPDTDTAQVSGSASVGTATLFGFSRNNGSGYTARVSGSSASISSTSTTPNNINLFIFAQNNQNIAPAVLSDARLAFYSIGESLNLALLDARVTTLINALGAAIP